MISSEKGVFGAIVKIQEESAENELHWLLEKIVIPEFPQILDALHVCSNLLLYNSQQHAVAKSGIARGAAVKLPVSSAKSEALKGIVVRDGAYITEMSVHLRESHFNKVLSRLSLKKPILLKQIISAKRHINNAIELIGKSQSILEDSQDNHNQLTLTFKELLQSIRTAKNALQLPTDPSLVFPVNVTPGDSFEPNLTPDISIDLYISQAEICIDMKRLQRINEKPWSDINDDGKSYIDLLRDEMKLPSTNAVTTPIGSSKSSQPLNITDIEERLREYERDKSSQSQKSEPKSFADFIGNLSLRPKHDPIDFITKCITYNNMVVMVDKKIEVSSPDPIIVSTFTKLDSIEYIVSAFLESLQKLIDI